MAKMDKIRILTTDGRLLNVLRIGDVSEKGSNKIYCHDFNDKNAEITFQDVEMVFGVYNFYNFKKGMLG